MAATLIIDDDRNVRRVLQGLLENAGFEVFSAADVDSGMALLARQNCELIITDLKMPGKSGMELLDLIHERSPAVPVIMITAYACIEDAVTAMKKGAYDFITKPFDEEELLSVAQKALSEREKNRELVSVYFDKESNFSPGIVGKTPAMAQVFQTVRKVASTDSTVLITGETGVGKELIARAVHLASHRKSHPLVKVNCAAIPENLLESELFGYERGAFTGAMTNKPGRFELADRGTIFLDEIGDLPLHLQAKLLSVLQDRAFERIGGVRTIKIDVRIIAATNKDLQSAVRAGEFRSDLFYRLNVVPIHIPPLRERKDDLVLFVEFFLGRFARKYERPARCVSSDVTAALRIMTGRAISESWRMFWNGWL